MIVTNSNGADLYQVVLGSLAVEERMRREESWSGDGTRSGAVMPGRHFERAEKNVRHAQHIFRKSRQRVVTEAATLFDRVPGTQIVLVGTAQNLAAFERELPEPLRAAVIARKPRPREWEEGDGPRRSGVLAGAAAAVAEQECRTAEQIVEEVVGESTRCGLAVLGPVDVAIALNEGRVHRLVLEEDFARTGWQCENCNALGADSRSIEACPYCGGRPAPVENLGEALVVRTLGGGGAVEVVAHTERLHGHRSVGALLRRHAGVGLATP